MATSDSIQQQGEVSKSLAAAGLSTDKINDLIEMVNSHIGCGPECRKQREIETLKKTYNDAQRSLEQAPEDLSNAEKNYYVFAKGEGFYQNMMRDRYAKEAENMRTASIKKHDEYVKELTALLNDYQSENIYRQHIDDLLQIYLTKNEQLKSHIDKFVAQVETSDRKVFYEDQQINQVKSVDSVLIWIYWIIFTAYCVVVLIIKKEYKIYQNWIILVLLGLFPRYILPHSLQLLDRVWGYISYLLREKAPKNVYTSLV